MIKLQKISLYLLILGTILNVFIITQNGIPFRSATICIVIAWIGFISGLGIMKHVIRLRKKDDIFESEVVNTEEIELYNSTFYIDGEEIK